MAGECRASVNVAQLSVSGATATAYSLPHKLPQKYPLPYLLHKKTLSLLQNTPKIPRVSENATYLLHIH